MADIERVHTPAAAAEGAGGAANDPLPPQPRGIAIACQGGGAQAAYTAGVTGVLLERLLGAAPEADDPTRWTGISGTSGGAISALVAWYGALLGGPTRARELLRRVWEYNSAQRPGEILINHTGIRTLDLFRFDFQLNPYIAPLRPTVELLTRVWPALAASVPPLALWVRPDFFRFDALVGRFVDFELVGALGRFLAVPDTIGEWQALGWRDALLDGHGLRADGSPLPPRHGLREALVAGLDARRALAAAAAAHPHGLLAAAVARWAEAGAEAEVAEIERRVARDAADFADAELATIRLRVKAFRDELPLLLLGAVDVDTGEFVAFSSKRAPDRRGITLDAVRASAAVPWIFRGVEIAEGDAGEADVYWDGLFSQNPPIADFFAGAELEDKPDEIWVVQVNPQRGATDHLDRRLWDRRNELAGNLSLNQEIGFARAINARIGATGLGGGTDKYVQILRIAMDSDRLEAQIGRALGPASKLDRSAELMAALFAHGEEQAKAFLPVRDLVELAWNRAGEAARPSPAIEGLPGEGVGALRHAFGPALRFEVDDLTIEAPQPTLGGARFEGEARRARLSWQCSVRTEDGQRGCLEGMAIVALDAANRIVGARMTSINLLRPDVVPEHTSLRTVPQAA